jgi:exopolyphosphatase/guanosine-5'-triphosphate,3'-diphosphate pyrophosphatase
VTVRGAIDCGTNSTRLLVVDGDGVTLERLMTITRLGEGVDATGRLLPEAIERTLEELRRYRDLMDQHGVTSFRAIATSAARDVSNASELFEPARTILGQDLEIISGDEEAGFSFSGATTGLPDADGPFLMIDIGGGSTEFAFGSDRCEASISLDVGSVRLTERYLQHDPPQAEELTAAISLAETHLDDMFLAIPEAGRAGTVLGVAGTITTVAAVEIGLAIYDRDAIHHFVLTRDAVEDVFRTLATEALADRIHNPGLAPERAPVIVGGLCVLVAIMRRLGLDELVVSESDILDGLTASLD